MRRTRAAIILLTLIFSAACGHGMSGTYQGQVRIGSGLSSSGYLEIEFNSDGKAFVKVDGMVMGRVATYVVEGEKVRVTFPDNTFIDFKREGDALLTDRGQKLTRKE